MNALANADVPNPFTELLAQSDEATRNTALEVALIKEDIEKEDAEAKEKQWRRGVSFMYPFRALIPLVERKGRCSLDSKKEKALSCHCQRYVLSFRKPNLSTLHAFCAFNDFSHSSLAQVCA